MYRSRVLAKLRSGRPVICTKTNLMDPRAVDIMGLAGFDCVWLCNEHVPNDWHTIENQIRAARVHDMDSLVRTAKGSYSDYIKPLEADATGIMVPHLMNAEEARHIVNVTRFKPLGRRPVDGGNADGRYCLTPFLEYIETANRERFVIVQIEDPEPMGELDEICRTKGIDMLFFGPADYSHSIGRPAETSHPDVVAARRRVASACQRQGMWCGTVATVENAQELLDEGFQFLSIGADVLALGHYFTDIRDRLRAMGTFG